MLSQSFLPPGQPARLTARGFTMIELMIAVVVVGILAAIAYPAYQKQVMRGRRSDAISGLGSLQQAQERYRANNQSYAASFDLLNCSGGGSCPYAAGAASAPSNNGYYTLSISQASPTGYTLQATPVTTGLQSGDTDCAIFQVVMTGGNAVNSSTPTSTCWPQ